jgi:glutathione S-transferase
MRQFSLPFEEIRVELNRMDTPKQIAQYSPSGRIPCLLLSSGDVVWESLAICEYLAEAFPSQALWPQETRRRAHARSICAEMHSGFVSMRRELRLDICKRDGSAGVRALALADVRSDVNRIEQIWTRCLDESGGPFLFGDFSIADAFFAPVALRFLTYGISPRADLARNYIRTLLNTAALTEWVHAAEREEGRNACSDRTAPT